MRVSLGFLLAAIFIFTSMTLSIRLVVHYPSFFYIVNLTSEQEDFICCNKPPLAELTGMKDRTSCKTECITFTKIDSKTYTLVEYTRKFFDADELNRWLDKNGIQHVENVPIQFSCCD